MPDLLELLEDRGFVAQKTHEGLRDYFLDDSRTLYAGFDPTAPSLHVGHMVPVMALAHAQRCGHRPIPLVGGGTGLIGDPSGKTVERQLLSAEDVERNCEGLRAQLSRFMDFSGPRGARMVNNADWLLPLNLVGFLRDIGKHFTVNALIARESVRRRLEDREQGISYTEFSYVLLQAYDFLHLFQNYNCTVQIGGNDQWGNIVSGIDLIGRMCNGQAYGLTLPLLLTADGTKFGKTEQGSVWLDEKLTSPYRMFQFWLNTSDEDVVRFLKLFTFVDPHYIEELTAALREKPEVREPQRVLAREFTALVHGLSAVQRVERVSRILFGESDLNMDAETLGYLAREIPTTEMEMPSGGLDVPLTGLLAMTHLAESKSAARKLIESGGAYVNNSRRTDVAAHVTDADLFGSGAILLRSGKKTYHLVRFRV